MLHLEKLIPDLRATDREARGLRAIVQRLKAFPARIKAGRLPSNVEPGLVLVREWVDEFWEEDGLASLAPQPTYNHTRGDSPETPCEICRDRLEAVAQDVPGVASRRGERRQEDRRIHYRMHHIPGCPLMSGIGKCDCDRVEGKMSADGTRNPPQSPDPLQVMFELVCSVSLSDHMGDVQENVEQALKKLGVELPDEDMEFSDLGRWIAKKFNATTLYGTDL